jgi:hypothetical protein
MIPSSILKLIDPTFPYGMLSKTIQGFLAIILIFDEKELALAFP